MDYQDRMDLSGNLVVGFMIFMLISAASTCVYIDANTPKTVCEYQINTPNGIYTTNDYQTYSRDNRAYFRDKNGVERVESTYSISKVKCWEEEKK